MEKLKLKIRDIGEIEREPELVKSLKSIEEYQGEPLQVLFIPYGGHIKGRDSDGEAFHEDTDIVLNIGDNRPITYYHGFGADDPTKMQDKPAIIGRLVYTHKDDQGHWGDAYLDSDEELAQRITMAIANGDEVKSSSGAVSHLVRMGEGGLIDIWPVGEVALFDTNKWRRPANELAIVQKKSAIEAKAEQPQDAESVGETEPESEPEAEIEIELISTKQNKQPIKEINKMENETEVKEEVLTKDSVKSMIDEAVKAALPIEQKGAPSVTKNAKESASWIKACMAWLQGDNPAGFSKSKEMTLYPESYKGAWEGGTDSEGGYTVPDDFYNSIVEQRDLQSWVRQAPVMKFTTGRDRILIPTEATAGTKLIVTDEEALYDENEPEFGQVALTIYKFTKMLKISEELMDGDGVGLEKYLASTLARAQAKAENYYLTVGTGTNMPQGLVYGATSSGVMMATSDVIVSTDITGARGVLNAGFDVPGEVGVLMAPSVMWYIKGITGSPFQFNPTPAGGNGQLFGEPVYLAPDCDALTVHSGKIITWFNYSAYAFAERNGLRIARNPYLYQANGQVGVFAQARFGGAITQALGTIYMLGHNT